MTFSHNYAITHTVGETNITPAISHQITFSSSLQDILCVDISILDNDIIDGAKTFNVVLTTDNELVTVGDPAVVKVFDDDCKCKLPYIRKFSMGSIFTDH